jgi:hypothetical protein
MKEDILLAEKLLSEAIVWSNERQWFVCRHCGKTQTMPFYGDDLRSQLHEPECFFVLSLDALFEDCE